jgi:hypothetical protein
MGDLWPRASSLDTRQLCSILEDRYGRLRENKPDGVLDLLDCGNFWHQGSDIVLLHALLYLLEFVGGLKFPSISLEEIVTTGRCVLATLRVQGVGLGAPVRIDFGVAHLWTIRENGSIAFQWFASPEDARRVVMESTR